MPLLETQNLPPVKPWMYPALLCVLALAQYMQQGYLRVLITLPLLCLTSLNLLNHTTGDALLDYQFGTIAVQCFLQFLDRIILTDEQEFRYIGRQTVDIDRPKEAKRQYENKGNNGTSPTGSNMSRLLWACSLPLIPRGVGWSWQVKSVPLGRGSDLTRWSFARQKFVPALICLAITDVAGSILCATWNRSTWNVTFVQRCALEVLIAGVYGTWMGVSIKGTYDMVAIIAVVTGINSPWQWPPIYGSGSTCYRVRTFWSSTYHQLLRRNIQAPAVWLCRSLRFKKGSFASRYTQLFIVFTISGLIHFGGSLHNTRSVDQALKWGDFIIFPAQAVYITLEDFVVWVWLSTLGAPKNGHDTGYVQLGRMCGRVLTVSWLLLTLGWHISSQNAYGAMNPKFGPRNASWPFVSKLIIG